MRFFVSGSCWRYTAEHPVCWTWVAYGPCKIKCHSMDRNCWECAEWQVGKQKAAAAWSPEARGYCDWEHHLLCDRSEIPPTGQILLQKPLETPPQNTKTATYTGTSLTGNREVISILLEGCSLVSERSTLSRNLRSFGFTYLAWQSRHLSLSVGPIGSEFVWSGDSYKNAVIYAHFA